MGGCGRCMPRLTSIADSRVLPSPRTQDWSGAQIGLRAGMNTRQQSSRQELERKMWMGGKLELEAGRCQNPAPEPSFARVSESPNSGFDSVQWPE